MRFMGKVSNSSAILLVDSESGFVLEAGAMLSINIEGETIHGGESLTFSVLNWKDSSIVKGLDNLADEKSLLLFVDGVSFGGDWDYSITGNSFEITMSAVPEPSICAAVFGALAFAFAARCGRKRGL